MSTRSKQHWQMRFVGRLFVAVLVALLGSTGSAFSQEQTAQQALYGLGTNHYHRLESQLIEGQTYHLFVRLPEEYDQTAKYPTVYLLDGGVTYPMLAAYYHYLKLAEEVASSIIIGISYGTEDWTQGNMRSRDFTAEAPDRSYWGGADTFQKVLRDEILALIENTYSSDPARRIIFGQSLGGQFVLYAALTAPESFWGFIASNPALHRNLDFFLQRQPSQASGSTSRLFVSSGSADDARFREPALAWMKHWDAQKGLPWALKTMTLPGQSHFSAAPEAFRQGMQWIMATP